MPVCVISSGNSTRTVLAIPFGPEGLFWESSGNVLVAACPWDNRSRERATASDFARPSGGMPEMSSAAIVVTDYLKVCETSEQLGYSCLRAAVGM